MVIFGLLDEMKITSDCNDGKNKNYSGGKFVLQFYLNNKDDLRKTIVYVYCLKYNNIDI